MSDIRIQKALTMAYQFSQMEGALSLQLVFHVFMEKTKYGK